MDDGLIKRLHFLRKDAGDFAARTLYDAIYLIEQIGDKIDVMQHQIRELEWSLECKDDLHQQDYARLKKYEIALSEISKMTMCMAVSYSDLAQKQKDLAIAALAGEKKDG